MDSELREALGGSGSIQEQRVTSKRRSCRWPFCRSGARMSLRDQMTLSPYAKWAKYRSMPWKSLVDALQLALVFAVIIVISAQASDYSHNNVATFQELFGGPECSEVVRVSDLMQCLSDAVSNFYSLDSLALSQYAPVIAPDGQPTPPRMTVTRYEGANGFYNASSRSWAKNPDLTQSTRNYTLSREAPLGPFEGLEGEALQDVVATVVEIRQFLLLESYDVSSFGSVPWTWSVRVHYHMVAFGSGQLVGHTYSSKAYRMEDYPSNPIFVLNVLGLFVNLWCCFLGVRSQVRSLRVYFSIRAAFRSVGEARMGLRSREFASWDDVPGTTKRAIIKWWSWWSTGASALLLMGNAIGIANHLLFAPLDLPMTALLGFGALMASVGTLRYFEFNRRFHILILTLRMAAIKCLRLTITMMPLFLGYAFCGLALFAPYSERFRTLDLSAVNLFALLNGDDMFGTFSDLAAEYPYPWVTRLYLYTFIILFITAVLNIFIQVIEDGYQAAKAVSGAWDHKEPRLSVSQLLDMLEAEGGDEEQAELLPFDSAEAPAAPQSYEEELAALLTRHQQEMMALLQKRVLDDE